MKSAKKILTNPNPRIQIGIGSLCTSTRLTVPIRTATPNTDLLRCKSASMTTRAQSFEAPIPCLWSLQDKLSRTVWSWVKHLSLAFKYTTIFDLQNRHDTKDPVQYNCGPLTFLEWCTQSKKNSERPVNSCSNVLQNCLLRCSSTQTLQLIHFIIHRFQQLITYKWQSVP